LNHKDSRSTVLRTVYGKVTVKSPRLWSCACQRTARTPQHVVHPLSKDLIRRVTPELEYLQAKWAAHLPYRQAAAMLKEVLPLDKGISSSGIRNRILDIGKQLDADIERDIAKLSAPTVKQRLAAIRHLFDWLVTGQIIPMNPAASVRGPRHTATKGKTPVLDATEARQLLDSIDVSTPAGLRDRALIGLMVFSFARIGAALAMRVDDVYTQHRRLWVRLREKGGKRHEMPCHHTLDAYLHAYLDGTGIGEDAKGPLFRTVRRGTGSAATRRCRRRTRTQWCGAARSPPALARRSATTRSVRPVSPRT
jgi:integrase